MKSGYKELFNHLSGSDVIRTDDPLKNIRAAMGDISFVQGNPLTKTEIKLHVSIDYFDPGGVNITASALPSVLKTFLPVYVFGLTDFFGGFKKLSQVVPPTGGFHPGVSDVSNVWYRYLTAVSCYIEGYGFTSGVNRTLGSMVISYYAWIPGTGQYRANVKIECKNIGYGTFLNSLMSDLITISTMRYIVPIAQVNQFNYPLFFVYQSIFGKSAYDNIDPKIYISNRDFQQNICDIDVNLPLDKALMLGFNMNYDCEVDFILFVEKVEPITFKKYRN